MPTPELSVIIVSYNTRELLLDCLRSLERVRDEAEFEVIVVDNASVDGSAAAVVENFPNIILIALPENLGFAAGQNRGIERAHAPALFVLNPDTIVLRHTIRKLLDFLASQPRAAVAGAGMHGIDGQVQPSTFEFPTLPREFLNFLPELKTVLRPRQTEDFLGRLRKHVKAGSTLPPFKTTCVSGAALVARTDAIRPIGGFDEGFFLYHEEMDLCWRLQKAGWEIWSVPEAGVIHWDAQSTGYRTQRLARSPVLEWRIGGMDRFWQKHTSPEQHRRWRRQAKTLLRLRIAVHHLLLLVAGRGAAYHRERIAEFRRVIQLLSRENRYEERQTVGDTA